MNENLHLSPAGANLIKAFESCLKAVGGGQYKAYYCPAHVLTIGWGHTNDHGRKFAPGAVWSRAECDAEFLNDMRLFEAAVRRRVKVPLTQYQFDALVSFSFNCGEGALAKSTLLRKVNAGDFKGAAKQFASWNKGGGRVLAGLVRRRASEALLFQNIADKNYDGRPDRQVQPPEPEDNVQPDMPQQVDPPAEEKKSWWQWLVGGVGASFMAMFEYIQTPWGFAAFCVVVGVVALFVWLIASGRIKNPFSST